MSWKQNAAVAAAVVALGLGAAAALDPPSTRDEFEQQQRQQQIQNLSDSGDNNLKRIEDEAEDQRRAEDERKWIPGEHRPHLPFPLRW